MPADLAQFRDNPTKVSHPLYDRSLLTTVAPEYSTGEVLLGSAYRKLLLGLRDAEIDLDEIPNLPARVSSASGDPEQVWRDLLLGTGALASPSPKGRQRRGAPQLMPIVPEVARYACVLGKKRSRWYPGSLLMHILGAGRGLDGGNELATRFAEALSVPDEDDLFARFLNDRLAALVDAEARSSTPDFAVDARAYHPLPDRGITTPAERFCRDLEITLGLKARLTRRQWTVLLEALLRIGLVMHVLWVCRLNSQLWRAILQVAGGGTVPSVEDVHLLLWECHRRRQPILEMGRDASVQLSLCISTYVQARIGINLAMFMLDETARGWAASTAAIQEGQGHEVEELAGLQRLLEHVGRLYAAEGSRLGPRMERECGQLVDDHSEHVACKTGSSKNMLEFARYSLGQIQPDIGDERAYDQSYLLVRKNRSPRSPWPVRLGPATLIALTNACCADHNGVPPSLDDLTEHLEAYGLWASAGELVHGATGLDLQNLGLMIDSPDAGGGRLLVGPFA